MVRASGLEREVWDCELGCEGVVARLATAKSVRVRVYCGVGDGGVLDAERHDPGRRAQPRERECVSVCNRERESVSASVRVCERERMWCKECES